MASKSVEVVLDLDGKQCTAQVRYATVDVGNAMIRRADPYLFPSAFRKEMKFFSEQLTAFIDDESPVKIVCVRPCSSPLPDISPGSSDLYQD